MRDSRTSGEEALPELAASQNKKNNEVQRLLGGNIRGCKAPLSEHDALIGETTPRIKKETSTKKIPHTHTPPGEPHHATHRQPRDAPLCFL
uniref:Uncharacterized protein n=1 Tax=uncultured SAR11 cluster alpha proteobacterium H17925_45G17 TaxID=715038 RepID=E7CA31_9PROT|nr:hypothetical protein [uncultured SAR11 cluster alpha proteobacterium H17925_45G17]